MFLQHPIRKLLVSISQLPYRFTEFTIFSTELKKHRFTWNKIKETSFADIYFFYVSSFIYKENHVLIEEYNHSEKIVIVEEELHGIDAGNLGDLLRLVFIDEKCGNPKAVVDGGDLTRNITEKKKPGILQACRSLLEML